MSSLDELEVVITVENLSTGGALGEVLTGIGGGKLAMAPAGAPAPHAETHELAGSDVINVGGLSGVLADAQAAAAHAPSHAAGAGDAVPVESLGTAGAAGTSPVSVGGTLVMLPRGRVINYEVSSLTSNTTTADTTAPPTVVLHSFPYSKQSATSNIVLMSTSSVTLSTAGAIRLQQYHGSTGLKGALARQTTGPFNDTAAMFDEITGLGSGAVTLGVKWSVNAGTASCSATAFQYQCTIVAFEVEP